MSANDPTRVLPLQGVHNFRDYGGYAVAGGGRLKRGLLWRSGQHHGATDADLEAIAGLDLSVVYDLRSPPERERHPCRRPAAFAATVHTADDYSAATAPHLVAARPSANRDAESTRAALRRNYGKIAFRPELIAMMRQMMADLAAGTGATMVNCMAGKDRTGIAVAMVHAACGVHRDDIVADYLLTNTAGDAEARIRAGAEAVRAVSGDVDEAVLRVLMGVEAEYLEQAFATIDERHGSLDAYLAEVLGADTALRERIRGALVEG